MRKIYAIITRLTFFCVTITQLHLYIKGKALYTHQSRIEAYRLKQWFQVVAVTLVVCRDKTHLSSCLVKQHGKSPIHDNALACVFLHSYTLGAPLVRLRDICNDSRLISIHCFTTQIAVDEIYMLGRVITVKTAVQCNFGFRFIFKEEKACDPQIHCLCS